MSEREEADHPMTQETPPPGNYLQREMLPGGRPVENVFVDTSDSGTGPLCMGSFASRGTHRVGNAVTAAAEEARGVLLDAASAPRSRYRTAEIAVH